MRKVTKVLNLPLQHVGKHLIWWMVEVEFVADGRLLKHRLGFDTHGEASQVCIGYEFNY